MQEIVPIHRNTFGMSFQWKKDIANNVYNKFQLIFRDTGFYLSLEEIEQFSKEVQDAKGRGDCACANSNCTNTRTILLRTPSFMVDLAVSTEELDLIEELIDGTLFQIKLDKYIDGLCSN